MALTAFIGGVLASVEGSADTTNKRELVHGIVAFGGLWLYGRNDRKSADWIKSSPWFWHAIGGDTLRGNFRRL